jgi:glutathione-regulated potassium-efflux system ancillary protein KefG
MLWEGVVSTCRILILFAHPALEKSRIQRQLIKAAQGIEAVTIHDLYETYPNFQINIQAEQKLLLDHDLIVFQHPFYWYSSPALLKEWQDVVLEYGFAYGHKGTALHGKQFLSVISTGGGDQAYRREGNNRFTIREFLAPFEQTARLCGMEYLPPFVVQGVYQLSKEAIAGHAEHYRQTLLALRDCTLDIEQLRQQQHLNEEFARHA